jgi:N-acetylglucosaminyldiphosphoundecaprenol N-acetyl-beta-D-mannosaminyltransferase
MQTLPRNSVSKLESQQFEPWYQPVYDLPSGSVIHNEVLLRWRSPGGALKSPKDFMPFIFESGLEQWLDRTVIEKTIETLFKNPQSNLSINLSQRASSDYQLAAFIHNLICEYSLDPQRIHLEISEKNISTDINGYIALIRDLRQVGCTVILDNFSNDYLTFVEWEKLNVDFVKIRGDLIQESEHDSRSKFLLKSIFNVGQTLNQVAVAKSIDAIDTSIFLKSLQCESVQGYHLKPPSPDLSLTHKVEILGVPIDNLSMAELLNMLDKGTVFTPNVDHLINVRKHKEFGSAYNIADYKLCDSKILFFASHFLGSPIREKISGSDLFPAFYQHHKDNLNTTIFLLGGMGDSAAQAQQNINRKVGRNIVVDACSPSMGFDRDEGESLEIIERINRSGATVLAIGVGAPKQENWVCRYRSELTTVKIIFAIGATVDFEAGLVARAPHLVSEMGAEWLYRLVKEPKRLWRRYLINDVPFLWLLLKQKMMG